MTVTAAKNTLNEFLDSIDKTEQNPLLSYNTYSYHHFLCVCKNTETAAALSTTDNDLSKYMHPSNTIATADESRYLYSYDPLYIDGKANLAYCVLINSMTDARFTIDEVEWTSVIQPASGTSSGAQSSGVNNIDGHLIVKEFTGARFIEILSRACIGLGVAPCSCTFLLKTVFVGHTSRGTVETLSYVKPFLFNLVDIQASFNQTGADYRIEVVSTINGFANQTAISQVATESFTWQGNSTFGSVVAALTKQVNEKLQKELVESKEPNKALLQFKVLIHSSYIGATLTASNAEVENRATGKAQISPVPNTSFDTMLMDLISRCPEITKQAQQQPTYYIPNIQHYEVTENDITTIVYTIEPRKVQVVDDAPTATDSAAQYSDDAQNARIEKQYNILKEAEANGNLLVYDYIFTGRNLDLLAYEMKLTLGLSTLMQTYNVYHDYVSTKTGGKLQFKKMDLGTSGMVQGGKQLTLARRHVNNPAYITHPNNYDSTVFNAVMARNAQYDCAEAVIEIVGNPRLLSGLSQDFPPYVPTKNATRLADVSSFSATNEVAAPAGEFPPLMRTWKTNPGVVKIRARMPLSDEERTQRVKNNEFITYADDFWFSGMFRVLEVTNKFVGGVFKQTITLVGFESMSTAVSGDGKDVTQQRPGKTKKSAQGAAIQDITLSKADISSENVKAFLKVLRRAEGGGGERGYNIMYSTDSTEKYFNDYSTHPWADNAKVKLNKELHRIRTGRFAGSWSSAAGAYQMTLDTYKEFSARANIKDFTPESQDLLAIAILKSMGIPAMLERNDFAAAVARASGRWASFPGSKAGQHPKPYSTLKEWFVSYGGKTNT